ncbi:hypothetical protein [Bacillus sp. USDA818B3_A]|uniref:hypothetical protein n=1 Tax=Bacillus sp. USDA818B3_A TaxID=2698834 RepID=UPI00136CA535|nr:hypothetical protein [Bacillus sp. USDA818B3_A]
MQHIHLKEKHVTNAYFQFIFPFSIVAGSSEKLVNYIQELGFDRFHLNDSEKEEVYYGNFRLNHEQLKNYFLPLTANILFPVTHIEKGFQRFSKNLNQDGELIVKDTSIHFKIHSIDLITCPFDLGFLTIRTEIENGSLSNSIEFADCFRRQNAEILNFAIHVEGSTYYNFIKFIIHRYCPKLVSYLNNDEVLFLENNLYVQSFLSVDGVETVNPVDLYRFGTFCSYDQAQDISTDASNLDYISNVLRNYAYEPFAPATNYLFQQNGMVGITTLKKTDPHMQRFYGFYYYAVLLNLFHKFVLLKIANGYSAIHLEQDQQKLSGLLYELNTFTSNYFYTVYPLTSEGQDIFTLLKKSLGIDRLYANCQDILFSLVKYEDTNVAKKDSMLLLVLTLYTVICGIFSMNLFTHDLQGNIPWHHFKTYNPFEYFAVFIVFSGMSVVAFLSIQGFLQSYQNRKNRKKWVRKTVWSTKDNR